MAGRLIDPEHPLPIYVQLKTLLRQEILSGRYGPGERLPTEHELCATHGISRPPVSRALSELAEEGVILRHRRRGTFVNPHWVGRQPGGKEVRVVVPDGPWEQQVRAAAPADVTLNIATVALEDLHRTLVHAVAEGRAPDVAVLDSVWVQEFATAGFLHPLDDLDPDWVRTEYEKDFVEPFVSANRRAGRPVAVQAEADVAGIWYRRADLDRAGCAIPQTWDALAQTLRALADRPHPLVLPAGSRAGETTTYCLLAMLASNGVAVLGPDAVTLDSSAAAECLAFVRQLVDDGLVPTDAVGYERGRPIRMLAHGEASLAFGGSYDAPALAAAASVIKERLLHDFGFVAMPAGPRGTARALAGGMVYGIFKQADNPGLAFRVLRALVSTSALAEMSRNTWQIAPRRSAIDLAATHEPFLQTTGSMLDAAMVRPATAGYPRVSAQIQAMLEAVILHQLTPTAAVARTAEHIAAITGLPVRWG